MRHLRRSRSVPDGDAVCSQLGIRHRFRLAHDRLRRTRHDARLQKVLAERRKVVL